MALLALGGLPELHKLQASVLRLSGDWVARLRGPSTREQVGEVSGLPGRARWPRSSCCRPPRCCCGWCPCRASWRCAWWPYSRRGGGRASRVAQAQRLNSTAGAGWGAGAAGGSAQAMVVSYDGRGAQSLGAMAWRPWVCCLHRSPGWPRSAWRSRSRRIRGREVPLR